MKKIEVLLLLFILLIFLMAIVNAQGNSSIQQNLSKLDKAYECLENKVEGKCSSLSIHEISLILLSSPSSSIISECKKALLDKESSADCWPSSACTIKDTALAILALDNLGENTNAEESWLLSKNLTPTDLIWYLQQDSQESTQCKFSYSGNDYTVNIADKKLDSSAGSCLTLAQSNFWLQISPNCYDNEFSISCDKNFIANFLYRNAGSSILFVLSDTKSAPEFGTVNLKLNSKCFGLSSCDYEGSLWATIALLRTGHDVSSFIPYLIALSDSNKKYLPNSFLYIATNYDEYGVNLIAEQLLGNYWQAESTAYDRFYDTALALIALKGSTADRVIKSIDWLLFQQPSDGCWQNSIRDTSAILWALKGSSSNAVSSGTEYCIDDNNFFCIPTSECPDAEKLNNFFCPGLSNICCKNENLKLCSEYSGTVCPAGKVCDSNEKKASDTDYCCLGNCAVEKSECENQGYLCENECSDSQESLSFACNSGEICCRTKTTSPKGNALIWILIIAIIIVAAIIAYILRNKIKLFFFKFKNKFRKEPPSSASGYPPRPGFPPIRRLPPRQIPRQMPKDSSMESIFKKLKDISK